MSDNSRHQRGCHGLILGQKVFIQTTTTYWTGVVVGQYPDWIVLKRASWVADAGLLRETLTGRKPFEICHHIEPEIEVRIQVNTIVTSMDFPWELPNMDSSRIDVQSRMMLPYFERHLAEPPPRERPTGDNNDPSIKIETPPG